VPSNAEKETEMDAERPDVRSSLARDVEDGESPLVVELDESRGVDSSDSELPLDGGDEGRSLEEGSGESLERPGEGFLIREGGVKSEDGDVLLSGSLLGLDESSRPVDADDEATGDLWVERSRVTRLFNTKDPTEPGNDLVRRRVRRLVKVDDTRSGKGGGGKRMSLIVVDWSQLSSEELT
jgi:hypothetical protein